ncbi:hypothetical protein A9X61_04995 [Enterobacter asburiae]|nr:hypothetical protein A9X61_04995 [Enterobacter asburiae]
MSQIKKTDDADIKFHIKWTQKKPISATNLIVPESFIDLYLHITSSLNLEMAEKLKWMSALLFRNVLFSKMALENISTLEVKVRLKLSQKMHGCLKPRSFICPGMNLAFFRL